MIKEGETRFCLYKGQGLYGKTIVILSRFTLDGSVYTCKLGPEELINLHVNYIGQLIGPDYTKTRIQNKIKDLWNTSNYVKTHPTQSY